MHQMRLHFVSENKIWLEINEAVYSLDHNSQRVPASVEKYLPMLWKLCNECASSVSTSQFWQHVTDKNLNSSLEGYRERHKTINIIIPGRCFYLPTRVQFTHQSSPAQDEFNEDASRRSLETFPGPRQVSLGLWCRRSVRWCCDVVTLLPGCGCSCKIAAAGRGLDHPLINTDTDINMFQHKERKNHKVCRALRLKNP